MSATHRTKEFVIEMGISDSLDFYLSIDISFLLIIWEVGAQIGILGTMDFGRFGVLLAAQWLLSKKLSIAWAGE